MDPKTDSGSRHGRARVNALVNVGLFSMVLLILTVADLLHGDRVLSEAENRVLAQRPEWTRESVLDGSFMREYETYVTDQFVGRGKWVSVKTRADILMRKREINGVWLCSDGYLIERHAPEDFTEEQVERKLALLKILADRWDARVMLVPTADNILSYRLPSYAEYYDQSELLERVTECVGDERYVDVYGALKEHNAEEIYYRTDHHWTSRGAFYGYLAWAESAGERPQSFRADMAEAASEDFLGTLHGRVNLPMEPDRIEYFPITNVLKPHLIYNLRKESNSYYEESYLNTKNQYGFFLDDNHAFIEIDTGFHNGRTLFVIKDSYANCLIPLLAMHYEKIYVTDLRYMNGQLFSFMESYEPEEGMDVLVLYNCVHFLEEFVYW
ncbi:MAG: DHHW family protein [Clostridium sp.]|nr:DHHW family protein [Acetatifactor muris]MCM1527778.1 DHHW family protein [Bacteroides sp.]MCM1563873.1 DHHW family protein [Clostridium sp.]